MRYCAAAALWHERASMNFYSGQWRCLCVFRIRSIMGLSAQGSCKCTEGISLNWVFARTSHTSSRSFPTLHFCRSCSAWHQHLLLNFLPERQLCEEHQRLLLITSLQLPQCLTVLQCRLSSTLRGACGVLCSAFSGVRSSSLHSEPCFGLLVNHHPRRES